MILFIVIVKLKIKNLNKFSIVKKNKINKTPKKMKKISLLHLNNSNLLILFNYYNQN
jgi:hypothetical protein